MIKKERPVVYYRPRPEAKKLGIYIHIPFCRRKCGYCDFYSVCDLSKADRYIDALIAQMKGYSSAQEYTVDSVYIGGGTPSLLSKKQIAKLFKALYKNFKVEKTAEISCEVNPSSATRRILRAFKKAKVNRLSIGAQSCDDKELEMLGRLHRHEDTVRAVSLARKLKFSNISLDVMYSLPGQTVQGLMMTLDEIIRLNPEHISLYSLKIEQGTPFYEQKDSFELPPEEAEVDMYFSAIDKLEAAGYKQYEISNFAKEGMACRHNLKYWNCEEYLGLGPAGASYCWGRRFSFIKDIGRYTAALLDGSGEELCEENIEAPFDRCVGEYVMLRFRLTEGIRLAEFSKRFPRFDFEEMFGGKLEKYIRHGFVIKDEEGYRFSKKGFFVSNHILAAILDFEPDNGGGVS